MQNYQDRAAEAVIIKPYNGTERAAAGNRLSLILFRSKKGEAKKQNYYAELPVLELAASDAMPTAINSYLQDAVNKLQDDVIRDAVCYTDEDDKIVVRSSFLPLTLAQLDWQGLADFASATKASTKLSKAAIEAWYDEQVAPTIAEKAAAKLGIADVSTAAPEQMQQIEKLLTSYQAAFAKMAAVAPNLAIEDAKALRKLTEIAEQDDGITKQLISRLDKIITPSSLGLGDLGL